MKKYLLFLLMTAFLLASFQPDVSAQQTTKAATARVTSTAGLAKTTASSTDTVLMRFNLPGSYYVTMGVQLNVARTSGTVTGKALLQYSNDALGRYWNDYNTDTASISFSSGTYRSKGWTVPNPSWPFWRVYWWQSSGTDTVGTSVFFVK